jgi:hypothetical protein
MFRVSKYACAFAFGLLMTLLSFSYASAHCFVGARFFPATLATDDPCVADEMSLPTVAWFKTGDIPPGSEVDISVDIWRSRSKALNDCQTRPSPTADMPGKTSPRPRRSRSRSCARTPIRLASPLTRGVGSSSGSSRGSGAIDGWQKTSRLPSNSARAFLYAASVMLLVRRIARA